MMPGLKLSLSGRQVVFTGHASRHLDLRLRSPRHDEVTTHRRSVTLRCGRPRRQTRVDSHARSGVRTRLRPVSSKTVERSDAEKPFSIVKMAFSSLPATGRPMGHAGIAKQGQNGRWNLWGLALYGDRKPFPVPQWRVRRERSVVVAERPVPGVHVERVGQERSDRAAVSRSEPRPLANLNRGGVGPRWRRDGASCSTSI